MKKKEGEVLHYCTNDKGCPTQLKGKIEHFIGRKAMDIDGLGAETVDNLFEVGLIKNIADLYELTFDQVIEIERMADKSVNNLLSGLKMSKEISFPKVLFGLGIRFVGETVAKKLANSLKNIDALIEASFDSLIEIDEIGDKIAISIISHFEDEENIEIVQRLKGHGLTFEIEEIEGSSTKLKGLSFVVSGVFTKFSRTELKELIESNGGKNIGSISKKTSFVVAGEKMGPSKLKKASDLGVEILTEDQFIALLNE